MRILVEQCAGSDHPGGHLPGSGIHHVHACSPSSVHPKAYFWGSKNRSAAVRVWRRLGYRATHQLPCVHALLTESGCQKVTMCTVWFNSADVPHSLARSTGRARRGSAPSCWPSCCTRRRCWRAASRCPTTRCDFLINFNVGLHKCYLCTMHRDDPPSRHATSLWRKPLTSEQPCRLCVLADRRQ